MNGRSTRHAWWCGIVVVGSSLGMLPGCAEAEWNPFRKKTVAPEPAPGEARQRDAMLADTIGEKCLLTDTQPLRLRGFGLVVGLGDQGGTDCPETIREYLIDFLTKESIAHSNSNRPTISPERLLSSRDCAVVEIQGLVPAGAPADTRFDVQVQAIGTQTRSIAGGFLLPCELKVFDTAASGQGIVTGRALARGGGPIFTNPFSGDAEASTSRLPRRGAVLGGGRSLENRTVRLVLSQPSYSVARRIRDRLNERFGPTPPVAEGMSEGYVVIRTPAAYANDPARFIDLSVHVLMENSPSFFERKLRELSEMLRDDNEAMEHASLIWEAMGRPVIPHIQPLYTHADAAVRFYAARAGIRLRDGSAMTTLERFAETGDERYGLLAVREIGDCGIPVAAARLYRLMESDNQDIRIAAYEGALNYRPATIHTARFPAPYDPASTTVTLDVIDVRGKPLIYARRSREPRVAVFGRNMPVLLPVFFSRPDELVTINASAGADEMAVFCRTRTTRKLSDRIATPPRVADLVRTLAALPIADSGGRFAGIGLDYTTIVDVLSDLCGESTIPAHFALEQSRTVDLLGPRSPDRPEADATPPPERSDAPASQPQDRPE